ncbi:phosphorylase family protein, partial [Cystoisospora suis]
MSRVLNETAGFAGQNNMPAVSRSASSRTKPTHQSPSIPDASQQSTMGRTKDSFYQTTSGSYGDGSAADTLKTPVASGGTKRGTRSGLHHPEVGTPCSHDGRNRRDMASSYISDSADSTVKTPSNGIKDDTASFHSFIGRNAISRKTSGNGLSGRANVDAPSDFRMLGRLDDPRRENGGSVRRMSSGVETAGELAGSSPIVADTVTQRGTATRRRSHRESDQNDKSLGTPGIQRNPDEYTRELSHSSSNVGGRNFAEPSQSRSEKHHSLRTRSHGRGDDYSPPHHESLGGDHRTRGSPRTHTGSSLPRLHSVESPGQSVVHTSGRKSDRVFSSQKSNTGNRTTTNEDPSFHRRLSSRKFSSSDHLQTEGSSDKRYMDVAELFPETAGLSQDPGAIGTSGGNVRRRDSRPSESAGQVYVHPNRSGAGASLTEVTQTNDMQASKRSKSRAGSSTTKNDSTNKWMNSSSNSSLDHYLETYHPHDSTEKRSSREVGSRWREEGGDESVRSTKGRRASSTSRPDRTDGTLFSGKTSEERSHSKSKSSSSQAKGSRESGGFFVGDSLPVLRDALLLPEGRVYHLGVRRGEVHNRILTVGHSGRADLLAESLLDSNRSLLSLTSSRFFRIHSGSYKGVKVSIVAIGMGAPMVELLMREVSYITDGPLAVVRL